MQIMKTTTRKRRLALFVAAIMALTVWTALPLQASAAGGAENGFTYTESGGNATITAVDKNTVTGDIEIPGTLGTYPVVSIGANAFSSCTLLTSVSIPENVLSIKNGAFYGCTALASVAIPDSVTSIGDFAFFNCTSLISAAIPDSVTSIGINVFTGCNSLPAIEVAADNANYSSVEGVLFNKDQTTLITYPVGNIRTDYNTIPDSVTAIGIYAFRNSTSLESITLPESVTTIGGNAFENCNSLESVNIPDSVEAILGYAFASCTSLASITIPDSVETIGNWAFYNCTSLESLTLPGSVTRIDQQAFQSCTSLKYIIILASVITISANLFAGSAQASIYAVESSGMDSYLTNPSQNTSNNPYVIIPVGGSVEGDENGNIIFTLPDDGGSVTTPPGAKVEAGDDGNIEITMPGESEPVTVPPGAQVAAGEGGAIEVTLPCEDGGDITIIAAPGSTVTTDGSVTTLGGTPLVLTAGAVNRTSNTAATVRFTSSAAGAYYYAVVEEGAGVPSVDTSGAGTACLAATQTTISLSALTAGAKDLYLVVKDTDGNMSPATFKIAIPAYTPPPPPATYAVNVGNGLAGNATYEAGATVNITANAPVSGKVFDKWTTSDGVTFASAISATTTFTMPAKAVTVIANYKDDPNGGGGTDDPPVADNGWVYANGAWKFFVDSVAQTGWVYDDGTWYYLGADGIMQTDWLYDQSDKAWYYLAGNGAMKTGWVRTDGSWYYLAGNGAMVAAKWFHDTDGSWYYLSGNGKMLTGKQNIGRKTYTFKSNGVWIS